MEKKPSVHKTCEICSAPFEVQPYRSDTAKYCSALCRQKGISITTAIKRGNTQRYRGNHRTYVKLNGRHMHRVIAEQMLGRPLCRNEIIHHRDGNKQNNEPTNLEILFQSEHVKIHIKMMLSQRKIKAGF